MATKKKTAEPTEAADVQGLVDALTSLAPVEAPAEGASETVETAPADLAEKHPDEPDHETPPAEEPAPVAAQPADTIFDPVMDAHIRRQAEGVAEYMPEEELAEKKRKALLEDMEKLDVENRQRWAEQQAEQRKLQAADEAAEIRKTIAGLGAQIVELSARADMLEAQAKG
jgi:hypothetical protein